MQGRRRRRRLSGGQSLVAGSYKTPAKGLPERQGKTNPLTRSVGRSLAQNDDAAERAALSRRKSGVGVDVRMSHTGGIARNRRSMGTRSIPITPRSIQRRSASRGLPMSRRSPFGSAGVSGGRSMHRVQLNNSELSDMYSTCIGLSARGKISTKNAWNLDLVDNMDKILEMETKSKRTHFQKASHTIHAASQIYGYRVDSVHTNAYRVLTNFNQAPAPGEGELMDGAGESAEAGAKRRKRTGLNTIASAGYINCNLNKVISEIDPMFHKTSSAFDEGGAKGLLMNSLTVINGCDIVFDSSTNISENACVEEPPNIEQRNWIQEMRKELKHAANTFKLDINPHMRGYHERISKLQRKANKEASRDLSASIPKKDGPMERKLNFDESMNAAAETTENFQTIDCPDLFFGVDHNEELFEAERQEKELQDNLRHNESSMELNDISVATAQGIAPAPSGHNPWGDSDNFAEVLSGDFKVYQETRSKMRGLESQAESNKENLLGGFTNPDAPGGQGGIQGVGGAGGTFVNPSALRNWAGPDQWFYRRLRYRRLQERLEEKEEHDRKKRKRAMDGLMDFDRILMGVYVPKEALLPPKKKSSTVLSERVQTAQATKSTILPQDLQWEHKWFAKLFTKPDFYCGFNRNLVKKRRMCSVEEEDAELQRGWYEYNNEADMNFVGNEAPDPENWQDSPVDPQDGQVNPNEELELIKAPEKLRQFEVEITSVQKMIDVKSLKKNIFSHIVVSCKGDEDAQKDATEAAVAAKQDPSQEPTHAPVSALPDVYVESQDSAAPILVHGGLTSFADTITSLKVMSKSQLSQLSVPFAFMCLLHLANEVNLRFTGSKDEKDTALTNFAIALDKKVDNPIVAKPIWKEEVKVKKVPKRKKGGKAAKEAGNSAPAKGGKKAEAAKA